jgi:hypothetical protein
MYFFHVASNTNHFHQTLTRVQFFCTLGIHKGSVQHVGAWLSMSVVTVVMSVLLWNMNFGGMDNSFNVTQNSN